MAGGRELLHEILAGFVTDPSPELLNAVVELVQRAHESRPSDWIAPEVFVRHALSLVGTDPDVASVLASIHAADLYLACACAAGIPDAVAVLEREHLVRVPEFVARVDASASLAAEVTQELRAKLLVRDGDKVPRIAAYSGKGSLGGFVRISAVRLARDLGRSERAHARREEERFEPALADPELAYMKRAYGATVTDALREVLETLEARDRALLKLHYVDGLSIEQVGDAFGVSRATGARMLAAARARLVETVYERLSSTRGIARDEAASLIDFVRSQIDLSLAGALRPR